MFSNIKVDVHMYYLADSTYSQHLSRPGDCSTVHVQAEMERGKFWE